MYEETLKISLKIHKVNTKSVTNIDTTDSIPIDGTEIKKPTNYEYLGQKIAMENRTRQEVLIGIKAGWSVFAKCREIFLDKLHASKKERFFTSNETWMPNMVITKTSVEKLETSQ